MKNIFKKYAALIGALCTVMLVISGCAFDELQVSKGEPGFGTVMLSVNGANARTIYPEVTFGLYVINITEEVGGNTVPYGAANRRVLGGDTINLSLRTNTAFTINVDAYINADDFDPEATDVENAEKIAATGTVNIGAAEIEKGKTKTKTLTFTPAAVGEGTFDWAISLDDSIIGATIELFENDGTTAVLDEDSNHIVIELRKTEPGATPSDDDVVTDELVGSLILEKGEYLAVITLDYGNSKEISFVEDLYIFALMTSKFEKSFETAEFYEMIDFVIGLIEDGDTEALKAEYFDILGIDYGTGNDAFDDVLATAIAIATDVTSVLPEDLADLKALVDAVFLTDLDVGEIATKAAAVTEANDAIKNGTSLTFTWNLARLTIKVGKYTVVKNLDPAYGCLDAELNAGYKSTGDATTWSMADWAADGRTEWATGDGSAGAANTPLNQAGGPTIALVNGGLNVTNRTANWNGFDIVLLANNDEYTPTDGLDLDPDLKIHKVTVYGVMLSNSASGDMRLQTTANANVATAAVSGNNAPFKLEYTLPSTFNSFRLRLMHSALLSYRVTLIEVEETNYATCNCTDAVGANCDVFGKTLKDVGSLKCSCVDGKKCDHNCSVCLTAGRKPFHPYDDITGTPGRIDRFGKDVVIGQVFANLAKEDNPAYFAALGNGQVGYDEDDDFIWVTNTSGNGSDALTILPAKAFVPDPRFVYRLNARGRTNGPFGSGRIEAFEIGGANLGDNTTGSMYTIPDSFNFTIILTASNIDKGLKIYANRWGVGDNPNPSVTGAQVFISIDDLIVYKEPATLINDFAITLDAPEAGGTPQTSISKTQYTGVVTWTPALVGGKFGVSTEYTATITITPRTGYHAEDFKNNTVFTINGEPASYTAATKTIVSLPFVATADELPPPPPGLHLDVTKGWKNDWGWAVKGDNPFVFEGGDNHGLTYRFPSDTFESGDSVENYAALIIEWQVTGGTDPFRLNTGFTKGTGELGTWLGNRINADNRTGLTMNLSVVPAGNRSEIEGFGMQREGWAGAGNGWTLEILSMRLVKAEDLP